MRTKEDIEKVRGIMDELSKLLPETGRYSGWAEALSWVLGD